MLHITTQLNETIQKITSLLVASDEKYWAELFENILDRLQKEEKSQVCRQILALFGGSGSINDLILYQNGVPILEWNDSFATLKSELFENAVECIKVGE
jgi:hypothetical protein